MPCIGSVFAPRDGPSPLSRLPFWLYTREQIEAATRAMAERAAKITQEEWRTMALLMIAKGVQR
jgi:hypothetical protein